MLLFFFILSSQIETRHYFLMKSVLTIKPFSTKQKTSQKFHCLYYSFCLESIRICFSSMSSPAFFQSFSHTSISCDIICPIYISVPSGFLTFPLSFQIHPWQWVCAPSTDAANWLVCIPAGFYPGYISGVHMGHWCRWRGYVYLISRIWLSIVHFLMQKM